jgi:hypothetical protein
MTGEHHGCEPGDSRCQREMKALEPADLNKLVEVAMTRAQSTKAMSKTQARADHQWAVLWALAIKTGLREGEFAGSAVD